MKTKTPIPSGKQSRRIRRKTVEASPASCRTLLTAEPAETRFTLPRLLPEHSSKGSSRAVRLRLQARQAERVILTGSFNNWTLDEYEMHHDGDGWWSVEVNLPPGRHEYRFLVDGEWTNGPSPEGYASNPFGTTNCVLMV